jgi:predicted house-cleaning noncanonical NTP pyrophosphatase (MazG superfamily)
MSALCRDVTLSIAAERPQEILHTKFILSLLFNKNKINYEKLEQLSMLSIDKKMEKDLSDVIDVVERMCEAATNDSESLIQFEYLG